MHLCLPHTPCPAVKKEKWVKDNQGQLIITAGQIVWTHECEKALSDGENARKSVKLLKKKWISYLNKLTFVTRSKLNKIERNKVGGRCGGWGNMRAAAGWEVDP